MNAIAAAAAAIGVAVATNYFACINAATSEHKDELEQIELNSVMAAGSVVLASGSLLLLYFFFQYISIILVIGASMGAVAAAAFVLSSLVPSMPSYVSGVASFAMVFAWLTTGHWALNDMLAVVVGCLMVATVKLPDLRTGVILLLALFFYDIFWVFFSSLIFGDNVMVAVATREASNPAAAAANALSVLPGFFSPTLELPVKIIIPVSGTTGYIGLGLGDIVLPGVYLCQIYRSVQALRQPTLFRNGMIAYAASLVVAFAFTFGFEQAQPALLYIVPGIIIPTLWQASSSDNFGEVWRESSDANKVSLA